MKAFSRFMGTIVFAVAPLLWGCGGQTDVAQFTPKGEGSIPIGRAQNCFDSESKVNIVMSDGRTINTVTRQQAVYVPVLPKGLTSITVSPMSLSLEPVQFVYYVGQDQFWAFNARPAERAETLSAKAISTNFVSGSSFRVGGTFVLETSILGSVVVDQKPTVVLSGGVARINSNDVISFTKPGYGLMILKIGLITRSFNFTVKG